MKSPQSNRSHPWKKVANRLSSPKNGEHYGAKDVGNPGDVRGSAVAKQKKDGIGVEAEVEVDYKRNPTPLFSRISHRLWDMSIARLDHHPSEARVWITSSYEDNFDGTSEEEGNGNDAYEEALGGLKWRNLPLHLALLHSPHPVPLKLVQALLGAHPNACQCRNAEGSLPLHLACDNISLVNSGVNGEGVIFALIECYPEALVEADAEGRTPIEILERIGKGRSPRARNESIVYFMRRQMMMQQEMRNNRERTGLVLSKVAQNACHEDMLDSDGSEEHVPNDNILDAPREHEVEDDEDLREANRILHKRLSEAVGIVEGFRSREKELKLTVAENAKTLEELRRTFQKAQEEDIENCRDVEVRTFADAKVIATLREKVKTLKGLLKRNSATYKLRLVDLKKKVEAIEEEKRVLEDELASTKEGNQAKEKENADRVLSSSNIRSIDNAISCEEEEERKALQNRVAILETENSYKAEKNKEYSTQLVVSQGQVAGLKETIEALEIALEAKKVAVADVADASDAIRTRIDDAEAQRRKIEAENSLLRQQIADKTFKYEQSEKSAHEYKESKEACESELSETRKEIQVVEETLSVTKDENNHLERQLKQAKEGRACLAEDIEKKSKKIDEQSKDMSLLREERDHLKATNESLYCTNEKLQLVFSEIQKSLDELNTRHKVLSQEKCTKEQTIASLDRQLAASEKELKVQSGMISSLKSKLGEEEKRSKALSDQCDSLHAEVLTGQALKLENKSLQMAVSSMKDVASEYREKIQEMGSHMVKTGDKNYAKINALKIANNEIQTDINRLESEISQLREDKSQLERTNQDLIEEIGGMNSRNASTSNQIDSQKHALDAAKKQISELEHSHSVLEPKIRSLQLEKKGLLGRIRSLEKSLEQVKSGASDRELALQEELLSMTKNTENKKSAQTAESLRTEMGLLKESNSTIWSKLRDVLKENENHKSTILRLNILMKEQEQSISSDGSSREAHLNEMEMIKTENEALKKSKSMLEKSLTRLTCRAAIHDETLSELASRQALLLRQRQDFTRDEERQDGSDKQEIGRQ